ncbi:MAG: PAS domain S-box protein, partial [Pirellulales bacterium]|nr:PAS domain S-box protein [Pirellulales bacterium]
LMFDASPAGMLIADAEGKVVLANIQVEKLFGYSQQELLGQPVELLIPQAHHGVHASHRARYMAQARPRPMAAGRDLFAQCKDGRQLAVDISLHPIETAAGSYVLANILDATERRQAARERESRQAFERLVMLGQLAGGVAHEIRTPLCVIRNDVYYLKTLADQLGQEGAECIAEIDEAVGKAERIVSELLDVTRDGPSQMSLASVNELIQSALHNISVPETVKVSLPETNAVHVRVDREQVERILVNLIRNAVQALNDQGSIEMRVGQDEQGVWVEVADNGPGVSPAQKESVFEPLFTTKPTGIGLGLAVSKRYAQLNGGELTVTDNEGGGACFRLTFSNQQAGEFENG